MQVLLTAGARLCSVNRDYSSSAVGTWYHVVMSCHVGFLDDVCITTIGMSYVLPDWVQWGLQWGSGCGLLPRPEQGFSGSSAIPQATGGISITTNEKLQTASPRYTSVCECMRVSWNLHIRVSTGEYLSQAPRVFAPLFDMSGRHPWVIHINCSVSIPVLVPAQLRATRIVRWFPP